MLFAWRPYIAHAITDDLYLYEQPLMDLVKFIFGAFSLIFTCNSFHDSPVYFAIRSNGTVISSTWTNFAGFISH